MSTLIVIRESAVSDGDHSAAKEKSSNRGVYIGRSTLLHCRFRLLVGGAKYKLLLLFCFLTCLYSLSSRLSSLMDGTLTILRPSLLLPDKRCGLLWIWKMVVSVVDGTYSMVLSKVAFFHKKYLDLYTSKMPSSIHD